MSRVQLLYKVGSMTKMMTVLTLLLSSAVAHASNYSATAPACLDASGQELQTNNDQVLQWKSSTPNQTLKRGHVAGVLTLAYPDRNGHSHFEIKIGPTSTDTLEIVYNISFGALPQLHPGMAVEVCGDYITSNAATQQYPTPSPDGAIMHWIHRNPSGHGHLSGYTILDGAVFGMGAGQGG